jgi:hypothetical protein
MRMKTGGQIGVDLSDETGLNTGGGSDLKIGAEIGKGIGW